MITALLWIFFFWMLLNWLGEYNDRQLNDYWTPRSGEYTAEKFVAEPAKPLPAKPLPVWAGWLITACCVAIPVGCIVAGLVLDIEWLWFWPGLLVAFIAYGFLNDLANKLPYLRKDQ
jgi:hypothetical protein